MLNIGRIAGQYAKPRTSERECVRGNWTNAYKGDCMNGAAFSDRNFDPVRLIRAYDSAAATLSVIQGIETTCNGEAALGGKK